MLYAYTPGQITQAEAPLLEAGEPLMERAAKEISRVVLEQCEAEGSEVRGSTAAGFIGPGNNGGDALLALANLAREGMVCRAVSVHKNMHAGALAAAVEAGVELWSALDDDGEHTEEQTLLECAAWAGIWIDGILGAGAHGPLRGTIATAVELLEAERQASPNPPIVIAADMPTVGAPGEGLEARQTVTFGALKERIFKPYVRRYAGTVTIADIGLEENLLALKPTVRIFTPADERDTLVEPATRDHKYSRGVVGLNAGSAAYPGAGYLTVVGALAGPCGMVNYRGDRALFDSYVERAPEIVRVSHTLNALVVGPGIVDTERTKHQNFKRTLASFELASKHDLPLVVDGGAIEHATSESLRRPRLTVLTPHAAEAARAISWFDSGYSDLSALRVRRQPLLYASVLAEMAGAVVVLKGSITVIALPTGEVYAVAASTPWAATAGNGDVLAGLMGSVLANAHAREGENLTVEGLAQAVTAAVSWHARAAIRAAGATYLGPLETASGGHPVRALDIAGELAACYGGRG